MAGSYSSFRTAHSMKSFLLVTFVLLSALGSTTAFAQEKTDSSELKSPGLKLVEPTIPDTITGSTRALNERMSEGVSPSENAAVFLVQLMGADVFEPTLQETSLKMMGIAALDKDAPQMVYMRPYAQAQHPDNAEQQLKALQQIEVEFHQTKGQPWKVEDYPALAEYFDANEQPLNQLVKIAQLPKYYAPVISPQATPGLVSASFTMEYRLPYLTRCLSMRAMRDFAAGDFEAAREQLIAAHKLAYLLGKGSPMDVSLAKAHWMDANPFRSELALLKSDQLTADQAKAYLAKLQELPLLPPAKTAAELGERFVIQKELELLRDDDSALFAFFDWNPSAHQEDLAKLRAAKINWKLAFERADEIQKQTIETLSIKDRTEQMREIVRLDREADAWNKLTAADETSLLDSLQKDHDAASRWIGEAVAMALRTNLWQRVHTEHRGEVRRNFAVVGLALVAYHREQGEYPTKLEDLVPDYLAEMPTDSHSSKPFDYRRMQADEAQLISWGANMQDDTGQFFYDDLVLRLE